MRAYGWSSDYIADELPGAQGWVYYYWALENEMSQMGSPVERQGLGYVGQESVRIRKQIYG